MGPHQNGRGTQSMQKDLLPGHALQFCLRPERATSCDGEGRHAASGVRRAAQPAG